MAFHVRDPETDALVRRLAKEAGVGLTEAVKIAVRETLEARKKAVPLAERLRPIQERIAKLRKFQEKAKKKR